MNLHLPKLFINKVITELEYYDYVIRSNIKTIEDCNLWVSEFGKLNNIKWNARSSRPCGEKINCSKKFVCQHSSFRKVSREENKKGNSKNANCLASVTCVVKLDTHSTRKVDPYIKDGLYGVITIKNKHNHSIDTAETLRFLPADKILKNTFFEYFNDNMGITDAINCHERILELKENFSLEMLANGSINPTYRTVQNWHNEWRLENLGPRSGTGLIEEDPFALVIVTPLMQRAHSLKSSSNVVFVDSTSACDADNYSITFMLTPCAAGAVPLAIIITKGQTYSAYNTGFQLLKECGINCFGGVGWPKVFITDNAAAEINAIENNWPNSIHLLCIFHVCQAVWRWVWDSKNSIPKDKRPMLMNSFQSILYANTIDSSEKFFNESIKNSEFPKWTRYLNEHWHTRHKWCLAWRDESTKGHHTNNYSEITVRIFKDTVLSRVKAYNVVALLDFTCTVLEDHYCRRLMAFANCRHTKNRNARIFLDSLIKKASTIQKVHIESKSEYEYCVQSENDSSCIYNVNIMGGCCSCLSGKFGKFCKHQCAVYIHFDVISKSFPPVTPKDRYEIAVLAQGNVSISPDFFQSFLSVNNFPQIDAPNEYNTDLLNYSNTNEPDYSQEKDNNVPNNSEIKENKETKTKTIDCIIDLIKSKDSTFGSSTAGLNILESRLKKVTTEGQWQSFLHTAGNSTVALRKRPGAKIRVQPTSIARRLPRVTKGSRRLPSGRPANGEITTKKRKRNLGGNVQLNVPNAKSHGHNH
ncbi:SWIM-type domain-containing protein [Aphis craccivora]|uniref:SWIM-type domain-containing protein n=1 Tax=Aphis craccivora TaxID=307492 RepID=A0A6G0W7J0_APHCR|nr:SWIM-type domain-containing protein [Aphis craccivora]